MSKHQRKTHFKTVVITLLFLFLSSLPACSKSEKDAKAPGATASKLSKAQKQQILRDLKAKFICPNTNASIAESWAEHIECPVGKQVLEITETLLNAGWSEEKVKATIGIYMQGRDLSFFIVDRPMLGTKDAPVTMVEFTDMQCPYCSRYFAQSFSTIKSEYIDTGKVRYFQLNLPLPFHKEAQKGAEALYCANEEGKYWEMRDKEFTNQKAITVPDLKKYAAELGLKSSAFDTCLDSGRYAQKVGEDMQLANKAGINGTPGFVVAVSRPDGKIRGVVVSGAQPTESFKAALDGAFMKSKAK